MKLSIWMKEYEKNGFVELNDEIMTDIKKDFTSISISNEDTLSTILKSYEGASNYLLDPHGAVAVAAVNSLKLKFHNIKVISLLTAHPAKFPNVMQQALQCSQADLPLVAEHDSIKKMKKKPDNIQRFNCSTLYEELVNSMTNT